MIEPKVVELKNAKDKGKNKRWNILNNSINIESSVFGSIYLHCLEKPAITRESVAKSAKSRKQRLDITEQQKKYKQ